MNKYTLIISFLITLEVFCHHKLLYCPVSILGCFHGNQCCVDFFNYFYTWGGGVQEVDIISTVRPCTNRVYDHDAIVVHMSCTHLATGWMISLCLSVLFACN